MQIWILFAYLHNDPHKLGGDTHNFVSPSREQVDKEDVPQQGSSGSDVSIRDPRGHESEHAVGRVGFVTTVVYALYKLCRTHGVSTGK